MYGIYTVPGKRDLCPNESSYRVIRALRGWLLAEPRLRMRSRTRVDPVGNYREYLWCLKRALNRDNANRTVLYEDLKNHGTYREL